MISVFYNAYTYMYSYDMMCKCWEKLPTDRPTFAELRSHFEELLEGQHASDYVNFSAELASIPDQKRGQEGEMERVATEGRVTK